MCGGRSLAFLVEPGVARSLTDAAYRFCRHSPGMDVMVTGTGEIAHLEDNLRSINDGPLPAAARDRLVAMFGNVESLSGEPM